MLVRNGNPEGCTHRVSIDNLGSHCSKAIRHLIRPFGAKLKHRLRKAAARSVDTVSNAIGGAICAECASLRSDDYGACVRDSLSEHMSGEIARKCGLARYRGTPGHA